MSTPTQFCTFHVGTLFLGVDVLHVQEVMRFRELAPVPLAPDAIEGLLNLRGQIVTAIDLRRRLSLPARPPGGECMLVIVRAHGEVTALVTDRIGEVVTVDMETFETPPETLASHIRPLVTGVHKLPGQILHILDAARTAQLAA